MILKSYELGHKNLKNIKYIFFYGNNKGFIKDSIKKIAPLEKNKILKYENEIIKNIEKFNENISNKSFLKMKNLL